MVKIGLIVEGDCERIVLKHESFTNFLLKNNIEQAGDIINLGGKGNLNTARMETQVRLLRDQGAERVFVLRDMDNAPCLTAVKQEVYQAPDVNVCVAVKELEAWFLADSETLTTIFQIDFTFSFPEIEPNPLETLKRLRLQHRKTGISDKKLFAKTMVREGFTVERAAAHPHCPSARYFLTKLKELTAQSPNDY